MNMWQARPAYRLFMEYMKHPAAVIIAVVFLGAIVDIHVLRHLVVNLASLAVTERYLTLAVAPEKTFSAVQRAHDQSVLRRTELAVYMARKTPAAWRQRGWATLLNGRLYEAQAAFRRALRLDPNDAIAQDAIAQLLVIQGRTELSMTTWRTLRAPARLTLLGEVLRRKGQPDVAIDVYQTAIATEPRFPEAYYPLGWTIYRRSGDLAAALAVFHAQRRALPYNPWSYVNIGDLYVEHGQIAKALPWYEMALAVAPHELHLDAKLAWAYVTYGHERCAARDPSRAAWAYGKALAIVPEYAPARHALANLLERPGRCVGSSSRCKVLRCP